MHPVRLLALSTCLFAASAAHAQTGAKTAAGDDWSRAMAPLRDAIECRAPLKATPAVRNVLRVPKGNLTGEYTLPEPLTVFGTLKVSALSVFEGSPDEGTSYTVKPVGAKLPEIAKAARLKNSGGRYYRDVKGGHVEAGEAGKGEFQVSCVFGESQE